MRADSSTCFTRLSKRHRMEGRPQSASERGLRLSLLEAVESSSSPRSGRCSEVFGPERLSATSATSSLCGTGCVRSPRSVGGRVSSHGPLRIWSFGMPSVPGGWPWSPHNTSCTRPFRQPGFKASRPAATSTSLQATAVWVGGQSPPSPTATGDTHVVPSSRGRHRSALLFVMHRRQRHQEGACSTKRQACGTHHSQVQADQTSTAALSRQSRFSSTAPHSLTRSRRSPDLSLGRIRFCHPLVVMSPHEEVDV